MKKQTDQQQKTLRGKTSIVPELLKQIPKGKAMEIINGKTYKTATIRSYIERQHKKGKLQEFTIQQRTIIDPTQPTKKQKILYVILEE